MQEFCIRTEHFMISDCFVCTCSYWVVHAGANKALLGEARAHEPVLAAMRAHAGVVDMQEVACNMLCNMAANNGEWLLQFVCFPCTQDSTHADGGHVMHVKCSGGA